MRLQQSAMNRRLLICALAGATSSLAGCQHDRDDAREKSDPLVTESPTQNETTEDDLTSSERQLEIKDTVVSESTVGWGSEISVTVRIHNHGPQPRDVWLGLSVRDVTGAVWNQDGTTHQRVQVSPDDTVTASISSAVERAAIPGVYDAIIGLWDRATDTGLEDRHDMQVIESALVLTEARPNTCPIRGDYLYIWADASDIVATDEATEAFLSELDCLGVSHTFLSWGALPAEIRDPENPHLRDFITQCSAAGVRVSVLWGVELGLAGIEVFRDDWRQIRAHGVSSVHIDLEPGPDAESQLTKFLSGYADVLTEISTNDTEVSMFLAPFWVRNEPTAAIDVRDHDAIDWTVIASYRTTEAGCREELRTALQDDPAHPYAAAFEFLNSSDPVVKDSITFWGERARHAMEVLSSIAADPPVANRFRGVALHEYDAVTDDHYRQS